MTILNRNISESNKRKLVRKVKRNGFYSLSIRELLAMFSAKRRGNEIVQCLEEALNEIGLCAPGIETNKQDSIDQEISIYPLDVYNHVKPLQKHGSKRIWDLRFFANSIDATNESEPIGSVMNRFRSSLIRAVPVVNDDGGLTGVVFRESIEGITRKKTSTKEFNEPIEYFHCNESVNRLFNHFLMHPDSVVVICLNSRRFLIISLRDALASLLE